MSGVCGSDPLAVLPLHDEPLLVTGTPFLQQGVRAQSYFPGHVPGVSLLPPASNFVDICGFALKVLHRSAEPPPASESD